jgi:hypothetical protein
MCYAAPGPRCSAFARNALRTAQAALDSANQTHATLLNAAKAKGMSQQQMFHADSPIADAYTECQQAEQAVWRACAEYDATPAGITDLKAQATRLEDKHGFDAVQADPEYRRILDRIENGRMRRDEQLTAYRVSLLQSSPQPAA